MGLTTDVEHGYLNVDGGDILYLLVLDWGNSGAREGRCSAARPGAGRKRSEEKRGLSDSIAIGVEASIICATLL